MKKVLTLVILVTFVWNTVIPPSLLSARDPQAVAKEAGPASGPLLARPGQSMTLLPDGRWFLLDGEGENGPNAQARLWDPQSGLLTFLAAPARARTGHSATVLPDGTVLIFGGIGRNEQVVGDAELFDPATQTFALLPTPALPPRAYHTATVLTDGRVLLAGGVAKTGETLNTADLWDPRARNAQLGTGSSLRTARRNHLAVLLPSGEVLLWGGLDSTSSEIKSGEWYNPTTQTWTLLSTARTAVASTEDQPRVVASVPTDGTTTAPLDSLIALRFSQPLQVETVNSQTITLRDQAGPVAGTVVAAEGGMLAFLLPQTPLQPAMAYTIAVDGPKSETGSLVPLTQIHFATVARSTTAAARVRAVEERKSNALQDSEEDFTSDDWVPNEKAKRGDWRSHRPDPAVRSLPSLQAGDGVTALAGQVLSLGGKPLAGVRLQIQGQQATTDATGRFVLAVIPSGVQVLLIDGRNAGQGNKDYGLFEARVEITAGQTNILPFTIWLPRIDKSKAVKIPSPTTSEVVVTTKDIPGLELRIPPGVTIHDHEGKVVTEVSITAIPLDRTPFPLPLNVPVPIYFTIQPGSAELLNNAKARIIYPNYQHELPGTRFNFWQYEPDGAGWEIYGQGSVNANGTQVVPDPGVGIYEFTGAMVANPNYAPPEPNPPPCDQQCCDNNNDGNPINLYTGLKIEEQTDLSLQDVIPLTFTRTYRPRDVRSRAFGIGASHSYDWFLVGSTFPYTYIDIILPDGGRIHYDRISPGTGYADAVYEHVSTQTRFYKSKITWNGTGYEVKLKDGTIYAFEEGFNATRPGQAGIIRITDRNGNLVSITRDTLGNVTQVTSPNGRWIQVTSDTSNRITQLKDNANRTVNYTYDASGRLWKVTDAGGGITEYTYDTSHRVLTKKDPRNNTVYTLQYDSGGRVIHETLADGSVYQFAYTLDGSGKVTQVDVTNPRNIVRRVTFNSGGYILTDTRALGLPEQQTTTYTLQAGTNFITSIIDALNRRTDYTYDALGNRTSMIHLAGTPDAMTTTYTYEPTFNQVASITDPLGHTSTFAYDTKGNVTSTTNPLNQQTSFTYNAAGQPLSLTDPLTNSTQMTYSFGDLATTTDPLSNTTTLFTDSVGRIVSSTNPLGQRAQSAYDALDRITQTTDPISGVTTFAYDPNNNLLSLTDARSGVTQYTYDTRNRRATRKDPLLRQESFQYDGMNNTIQTTDRKSQLTATTYDGLNRRTQVTYADGAMITYTYDAGNRITQIVDSVSGTLTRTYDGMDNLLSETTPQGTVSYTYDHADRRVSMTVAGQPTVTYTYDNADRLTQITQGTSTTTFAYDAAGRRTSLTLPNGVVVTYSYNAATRLTGLTYTKGATTLGDLTYTYDKAGERIATGGSFARTGLPQNLSTATYDAANQQLALGNKSMTFDANGNLATLTDPSGTTTYTWNARNQLAALSGSSLTASFQYDALGRRQQKTVNGTTAAFLYDGLNAVQELNGTTPTTHLLTGLEIDEVLQRTDSAGAQSVLADALGSAVALTDPTGAVQTEYTYEPFGNTTISGAASTNAFQYTGRENDGAGLYYYRARYYHSGLQRFVAQDPIGFAGGDFNLYGYVRNNPISLIDPIGLFGRCDELDCYNPRCHIICGCLGAACICYRTEGAFNIIDVFPATILRNPSLTIRVYTCLEFACEVDPEGPIY